MRPFDYKLLYALDTVISEQSFEKAALKLNITQSAISQRIKQLEQLVASPILVRTQPLVTTPIGEKMLMHFRQVRQLEYDLASEILPENTASATPISIAVNADTLASWFLPALSPLLQNHNAVLNVQVTNETNTQALLKKGEVYAAISTEKSNAANIKVDHIGNIHYILCASKAFKEKYFKTGITKESLSAAPCISFDQRDTMHSDYLKKHFSMRSFDYPCHRIRSSEAFVTMTLANLAYGLLPITQAEKYLKNGELIDLAPDKHLIQPLYWHRWVLERGIQKLVSNTIIAYGKQHFEGDAY